ncbi:hypothetical protein AMST5_01194 [freshwater sediment metagenome]|jgi:hypothetical protein|uniref:Uncharacterized protein n=1 Tax=freshwater sediment metagenome TaxID=556182 RepID=A0AA48R9E0_9ZZZZ
MKSSAAKAKQVQPDRMEAVPTRLREIIAKTSYEAPKVVSFPFNQTKGTTSIPQVSMMGNGY